MVAEPGRPWMVKEKEGENIVKAKATFYSKIQR
jgi:hypothetical protein